MQKKFLTYCLLFFAPVVIGYLVMEYLSSELPSVFSSNVIYINKDKDRFETLVLGSSQMQSGVNPEWLTTSTLNLASGNQHHDTDFKLLKGLQKEFPKLKTVVLEVSYSHFELPHNGPDFWKNALYLKYYDVNCYERATYFKDRLLYLANPSFYSERIVATYIDKSNTASFNSFGFNTENYEGQFKALDHDETKIAAMKRFKINTEPNLKLFQHNTKLFQEMLEYLNAEGLEVIICELPMYKTYHERKNPDILRRRDSVIDGVLKTYPNVTLLNLEMDTLNFEVHDYWNQSHLNPKGAKKFSARLNVILDSINDN